MMRVSEENDEYMKRSRRSTDCLSDISGVDLPSYTLNIKSIKECWKSTIKSVAIYKGVEGIRRSNDRECRRNTKSNNNNMTRVSEEYDGNVGGKL